MVLTLALIGAGWLVSAVLLALAIGRVIAIADRRHRQAIADPRRSRTASAVRESSLSRR